LWRLVGGEVLLADAAGPDVNCLSAPASAAWLLLDRPRTREELSNELASAFGGSSPRIRDHVERLLDQLRERGWVISDDERD
jgi:DNA-binding IclR family transcriptional regulator